MIYQDGNLCDVVVDNIFKLMGFIGLIQIIHLSNIAIAILDFSL